MATKTAASFPTTTITTFWGPAEIMEGSLSSLSITTEESVKALAEKKIALPHPCNIEQFEAAKKELIHLAQSETDRNIIQKVTSAFLHISFPMLGSELQNCITTFNQKIGATPYDMVSTKHKSNQWIAQLALKYGIIPPEHVVYLRTSDSVFLSSTPIDTALVLDDCSYTGAQISRLMQSLTELEISCQWNYYNELTQQREKRVELVGRKPDPSFKPPVKTLYLLIPFISAVAKERIEDQVRLLKEISDIDIFLITGSVPIPTAKEALEEEEYRRFQKLFKTRPDLYGDSSAQLAFTDWRVPDGFSIPRDLIEGKISYTPPVKTSIPLVNGARFRPYLGIETD